MRKPRADEGTPDPDTGNVGEVAERGSMPGIAFDIGPSSAPGFRSIRVSSTDYQRAKDLRAKMLERGSGELPETLRAKLLAATDGGTRVVSLAVVVEMAFDLLEEQVPPHQGDEGK